MRAKPDLRGQRVHWLGDACKPKPHIGDGWIVSRLFVMVDGNGASLSDDTGQSLSDTGE